MHDAPDVTEAYLALGANLGDRLAVVQVACAALGAHPDLEVEAVSPIFETVAEADEPQPAYLNACLRVRTSLTARALLDLALSLEASHGRVRDPARPRASRTLDVDILLFGDAVIDEPGLSVPHPRMLGRAFVRIPLARVARPGLRHPQTGDALDQAADDASVRLFAGEAL